MKTGPAEALLIVIVLSVYAGLVCVPLIGVARKMGFPGITGLLVIIPGINILLAWFLALREWPIERELRVSRQRGLSRGPADV